MSEGNYKGRRRRVKKEEVEGGDIWDTARKDTEKGDEDS